MATIKNQAVAKRLISALTTRRVFWSGCFNSHGLRGTGGLIKAIQQSLFANSYKNCIIGPITLTSTDSATGADAKSTTPFGGTGATMGWSRVVTSQGASNSILSDANIQDASAITEYATVVKWMTWGRANDGGSLQYPTIYRALAFLNSSVVNSGGSACGFTMTADPVNAYYFDRNAALTFDFYAADKSPAGGQWRPAAVQNAVPNARITPLSDPGIITVGAGTATTMTRSTMTLSAATRDTQLRVGMAGTGFPDATPGQGSANKQIYFGYSLGFETATTAGWGVAPFMDQGGWSVYDFAYAMGRTDGSQCYDESIDHWIDVVSRPAIAAGQNPMLVFQIGDGSNQTTETSLSITVGYPATSWMAYADNAIYVMKKIQARWIAKGFNQTDLIFILTPDHPRDAANNVLQRQYRTLAMSKIINQFPQNAFGVNADDCVTFSQLLNAGNGNDTYLAAASTTTNITAIAARSNGLTVLTSANSLTTSDYIDVNGTAEMDGIYAVVAATGSTITVASTVANSAAGAAGTVRVIDQTHLSVPSFHGGVLDGYDFYWTKVFNKIVAAGNAGPGGVSPFNQITGETRRRETVRPG